LTAEPPVVRGVAPLRAARETWRRDGLKVGLVPTMGALHQGHLSLVERARQFADRVIVSIFVNPKQFGPREDLAAYPRDFAGDRRKLMTVGTDLIYAPEVRDIYPPGFETQVRVNGLTTGLCGEFRPGHFEGVATVVSKLLIQVMPDVAVFGEKDYQQLQVIRRLTLDLDLPVRIEGGATYREADGLAMSSRNAYLSAAERAAAPILFKTISEIAAAAAGGAPVKDMLTQGRARIQAAGFSAIDYLEMRDAETLAPLDRATRPARVFVAAHIGRTRLIDNVPVPAKS
jgi:pantoate--beta-alanine ligase